MTARVWERGVGETSASGTSAVAVAAATHGEGSVVVSFPGGDLDVRLDGERAWLTGPAERVLVGAACKTRARSYDRCSVVGPGLLAGESRPCGSAGADAVLAQRVVQARPQVGRLLALADDQRARELVRPGGELLRPRPGTTTERGGT